MCDEVSVVVAAAADGSSDTPALFATKGGFASEMSVSFALQSAEVKDGGSVWLRYMVKGVNDHGKNNKRIFNGR